MATLSVRLEGLDDIERKLGTNFQPVMRGATKAIAAEIQGKIAPYPASTEANRPAGPGSRWYERGYGSRWMLASGRLAGRKTSETLGRRWAIATVGRIGAKLGNAASYAAFAHDDEDQVLFHARRGWKTDKWAVDTVRRAGTMGKIMSRAVIKAMRWGK